jgi:hypothetical protein
MEPNIIEINRRKKTIEIMRNALYRQHEGHRFNISSIEIKDCRTDDNNLPDLEIQIMVDDTFTELSYLSNILKNYDYDIPSCKWFSKTAPNFESISFFTEIPIEINSLFTTPKNIVNMYKNFSNNIIVLELDVFDSNNKTFKELGKDKMKLVLYEKNKEIKENSMSLFRNLLNYNDIKTVCFSTLFSEQYDVENNIIYMKTGGYFNFLKLIPVSFEEVI